MAIGYTNSVISFGDDDLVTTVYTDQRFPLGLYREQDGKGFRFVKFDNGSGNVAAVVGGLAYSLLATDTSANFTVTMDVSDSALNKVRGVFVSVPADAGHCWIQTKGVGTVLTNGDDDIAIGQAIIPTSTDGAADSVAVATAPTHRVVGWAWTVDVDAANTVLVDLCLE